MYDIHEFYFARDRILPLTFPKLEFLMSFSGSSMMAHAFYKHKTKLSFLEGNQVIQLFSESYA